MHRRAPPLALAATALLGIAAPAARADDAIRLDVTRHVLPNGMRFLLLPWGDAPVVATFIRFDVGGVDDPKGQTGVAHLLEHMMFKGTTSLGTTDWLAEKPVLERLNALCRKRDRARAAGADAAALAALSGEIAAVRKEHERYVVKNEIWQIYDRCGGTGLNASTDNDSTQYYVQLPSNQLEVWARVESDRIANPVFREFYSERDVVHEERRLRTDSQPRGLFGELFDMNAWLAHPYRQPVVGWPSDIDNTDDVEVLAYFKTWYAPNNCVVALVGDVDVPKTIALIEKWFGSIPAQELSRRPITAEPALLGERRFRVELDAPTSVQVAWPIPARGHADLSALSVAGRILSGSGGGGFGRGRGPGGGGGPTAGRLRQKLVDELKVAARASARPDVRKYPGLFQASVSPARGKTVAEVEAALCAEVARLAAEPPTEVELARVKTAVASQAIRGLSSATAIAQAIAHAEATAGDWRQLERDRESLMAVTAADVARVVQTYLSGSNRIVGILQGPPEPEQSEAEREEAER